MNPQFLELLSVQHSAFARQQAPACGVPLHVVDHLVGTGELVTLHRGVYRFANAAPTWKQALVAACLAAGPQSVVSHRSAAVLWQLLDGPQLVEITVPHETRRRVTGAVVHRGVVLKSPEIGLVAGIRVTKPARTLIDLAAVAAPETLEKSVDSALSRRLVTCSYLRRRVDALGRRGRKGIALLLELLDERPDGGPLATSEFERLLFRVLVDANVPRPVPQYEVVLPSGRRVRLDYAYPCESVALEADSYRYHSSRSAWASDHARNAELTAVGWRILPITWDALTADPRGVIQLVATALDVDLGKLVPTRSAQVSNRRRGR